MRLGTGRLVVRCALGVVLAMLLAIGLSACGYRAVYTDPVAARLHVKLVRTLVADAVASDEVTAGAREALARAGALEGGDGYPRIEIEVLRADESSEGIAAGGGSLAPALTTSRVPVARAIDVGLVARAWIVRSAGAGPESDTGDLRAEETLGVDETASGPDPRASAFHQADARRAAARRLGRRLAYKVTGEPAASDDGSEER